MIWKFIPIILVAGLSACASTGNRAGSNAAATSSSTTTSQGASGYGAGYTDPMAHNDAMCDAQPVQNLIGTKLTSDVESRIRQASSSGKTRVLKPGEVMTMEYDPHRINLILDQQGALTALRCG